jgi:hypothetical protein
MEDVSSVPQSELVDVLQHLETHWKTLEREIQDLRADIDVTEDCMQKYGEIFRLPMQYLKVQYSRWTFVSFPFVCFFSLFVFVCLCFLPLNGFVAVKCIDYNVFLFEPPLPSSKSIVTRRKR